MPCYSALALLIACVVSQRIWFRAGTWTIAGIAGAAMLAIGAVLFHVWSLPAPGDISNALTVQPIEAYTLSLGHMGDLTLDSFAYLRVPLMVAGFACLIGASASWWRRPFIAFVVMMVLFFHAARFAMVAFDPYLSSRPLAEALVKSPPGELIEDNAYYTFSSVFFYANRRALLLNGRKTNLEYGSYAPGAPNVFIEDSNFRELWTKPDRYYLLVEGPSVPRIEKLVGRDQLHVVIASGGKFLMSNHADSH
jgi:hypothetical protein